ncbi:MAG: MBL fold metallo-hydrolase [Ignavibacteriales bacterium]|nr:MBL fold metallo-hydrolase [Ignavibacteriales bacterium]
MELIFIGTSSGRTSLTKFHSSLLFKINSKNILIDSGDGISKTLLNQKISANKITDIIFSHYHSDHLAGLPSLITQMIINNRSESLNIFTHAELVETLKHFLEISYIFIEKLNFKINIEGFEFGKEIKILNKFIFTAKQNSHIKNKHNIESETIKFLSAGFLFNVDSKKIIYTSDIGDKNDLYLFPNESPDIFITESNHIELKEIEEAANLLRLKKVYLTHIDDESTILSWYNKLSDDQKEIFILAEDGMKISL